MCTTVMKLLGVENIELHSCTALSLNLLRLQSLLWFNILEAILPRFRLLLQLFEKICQFDFFFQLGSDLEQGPHISVIFCDHNSNVDW